MHNNAATSMIQTLILREKPRLSAPAGSYRHSLPEMGVVNRGHGSSTLCTQSEGKQNWQASLILATRNTGVKPRWLPGTDEEHEVATFQCNSERCNDEWYALQLMHETRIPDERERKRQHTDNGPNNEQETSLQWKMQNMKKLTQRIKWK
jgi:DNA segregation ATPase FtsK/SpoIIIE-like protein